MARWTELKDFRDDCRSVQASGGPFSTACENALRKALEPPPYAPSSYFSRMGKRDFDVTWARGKVYEVTLKVVRVSRMVCRWLLLRGNVTLLAGVHSLESTNAVTVVLQAVRQAWNRATIAAEHVGLSREIIQSACQLLLSIWDSARILQVLIASASQRERHQTTEFAHCAKALSKALLPWSRGLSLFFNNNNIRKFASFCFHPWTFDSVLLLLSTVRRFRSHKDNDYYALFILILLVHHLILWPFWCNNCHGAWWRIISLLSDSTCCALIFIQQDKNKRMSSNDDVYSHARNIAMAMIGIELGYDLLLLVNGFRRSFATFGILFATAVFFVICFLINLKRRGIGKNIYDVLDGVSVMLLAHFVETCFITYCSSILGMGWSLTSPWLLTYGMVVSTVLFWISYTVDIWAMFTFSVLRVCPLKLRTRKAYRSVTSNRRSRKTASGSANSIEGKKKENQDPGHSEYVAKGKKKKYPRKFDDGDRVCLRVATMEAPDLSDIVFNVKQARYKQVKEGWVYEVQEQDKEGFWHGRTRWKKEKALKHAK